MTSSHPAAPAGQRTVRRHNAALVLRAIADTPGLSRAEVATRTGLTKATVSSLVERLMNGGLVAEAGPAPRNGPGRRGAALSLSPAGPHGLGVEIGVDYLATCLVDLTGTPRGQWVSEADNRTEPAAAVLDRAAGAVRACLAEAARLGVRAGGVGVALPGLVEAGTGTLRVAPNLGWHDIDIPAALRARVDLGTLPVLPGNEANFAALAELWAGGPHDYVHVSGEIGIGAGIVIDGTLFEGVRGFGGELGHFAVDPGGPECPCGARGCLERLAGQEAVLRRAGVPLEGRPSQLLDELIRRLEAGQPAALEATADAGHWLGVALADVVNLLDVPTVVLGGAYARLHPWLAGPLAERLRARVMSASFAPVRVLRSALGGEAAARGAAGAAVRAILADPESFVDAG
ncbi:ROK family transcriptional regulator [Amycolatopsis suaedae]|uniref:ROK family transcriptional regulator n=1 Tax=Amycolatopsis suaedae TaxID=2510978 RepID=A0A4Q7J0P8_9PSEU|nr:ROK family transcriptional regulator [Amycolatopsis suaedae]RZQ60930.1 ROK family transcriptional regulator [Amycolatopsis suaedae]